MRRIAALPLVALVIACGETATAPDDPGHAVNAKPQGKGPKAEHSFVYDTESNHTLGSDCWKTSPEIEFGKTFWCGAPPGDPTFVLRILKDGEPVEGGEVTFKRCECIKDGTRYEVGTVMDWPYCGVLLKRYRRHFGGVDYRVVQVGEDGTASVTLDDFWSTLAREEAVWGMHWEYDQGDGGSPEADVRWVDLAKDGYVNPPDTG